MLFSFKSSSGKPEHGKSSSSKLEPMVSVRGLGLHFRSKFYRTVTVRDLFVQAVKNPWETLLRPTQTSVIFEDLNFDLYRGDRVGLVGINGVGKSSLCRCIAGIYQATRGTITVAGECRAVFDTGIGIQPELTGRENAEILAELLFLVSPAKQKELVDDALRFAELGDYVDTPFKFYSNGMQARLCLSLVSAMPADVLILDEVFDGADQFFRKKIAQRVKDQIEHSGTVIFVSHSFDQVQDVCNRVILLHERKIIFDGSPKEAYEIYCRLRT
jgi:ABC-type polysaccharide/polyol phosphate transport system ATPase subunit